MFIWLWLCASLMIYDIWYEWTYYETSWIKCQSCWYDAPLGPRLVKYMSTYQLQYSQFVFLIFWLGKTKITRVHDQNNSSFGKLAFSEWLLSAIFRDLIQVEDVRLYQIMQMIKSINLSANIKAECYREWLWF